jgi:hypothetical protein
MTTEHPAGDGRSQPGQRALGAMESAVQRARASQGLPTPVAAGGPPPPPVGIPPEPPERCRLDRAAAPGQEVAQDVVVDDDGRHPSVSPEPHGPPLLTHCLPQSRHRFWPSTWTASPGA